MEPPLVSLSIIAYNQRELIEETLQSALGSDYPNLEIVVADDASRDGTAEVIRAYAERDARIVPLLGETNLGVTGNSNRALAACRGKYVALLGGDDLMSPQRIRLQVEWLEHDQKRVLCGTDFETFDSETGRTMVTVVGSHRSSGRGAGPFVRHGTIFVCQTVMVRASSIPSWGFDERVSISSDWKFVIDCLADGGEFGCIPGVQVRYRRHPNSITSLAAQREEGMRVLFVQDLITLSLVEAHYPHLLQDARGGRARVLHSQAVRYLASGQYAVGRRYLRAAMALDVRRWPKAIVWMLLSFVPRLFRGRVLTRLIPER